MTTRLSGLTSMRSVPMRPRVGRKGRFRAPAPNLAFNAVSDSSSTRMRPCSTALRYCWHSPNCSIDTAAPMRRSITPAAASQSTAIPPTSTTRPRSAFSWRISSLTADIGGSLGGHVLEGDDVRRRSHGSRWPTRAWSPCRPTRLVRSSLSHHLDDLEPAVDLDHLTGHVVRVTRDQKGRHGCDVVWHTRPADRDL